MDKNKPAQKNPNPMQKTPQGKPQQQQPQQQPNKTNPAQQKKPGSNW